MSTYLFILYIVVNRHICYNLGRVEKVHFIYAYLSQPVQFWIGEIYREGGVKMAVSKAQQRAVDKYVKNNYDRVEFKPEQGEKARYKAHAEKMGESLNQFLIRAVDETIQRDNEK